MNYDVIVVGAGVAGSAASYYLAKAGHKVLLLDKCEFPREKVCGDSITPRGVRVLEDMEVVPKLEGRFKETKGVKIYSSKGGCSITDFPAYKDYPRRGFVVPRIKFDKILKEHAEEAGACFSGNSLVTDVLIDSGKVVGVKYTRNGKELEETAKFVVCANGMGSNIAKKVLNVTKNDFRAIGIAIRAYYENVNDIDDYMEIYGEDVILPGVGWIFPQEKGIANVGVGIYLNDLKEKDYNIIGIFNAFVNSSVYASKKLKGAKRLGPIVGKKLHMGGVKRAICDGMVLVGDAAGLVNPLTGEGMMYALESGKYAAEAIGSALSVNDFSEKSLIGYQKNIDTLFNRYFILGALIVRFAKNPWIINSSINLIKRSKKLGELNLRQWISIN
ncbi:geranylgeranyl reductase family protein [Candidatus Oleimmundimicrobium sp.]|uniref:NAD(P)/FAD-dependent oxidoreductase n=1 Tax=Candidatus Oleimmundimicrobium sp. TaxID=3060597 RepID=UPI0027229964|nr:geranylgeranyl reductase family protein [Candidatus Oleimmundimicrobium sp.]MDO8885609.1 geranylgeranyl reductase family protein [Candidatus Oleimmundimicrobium sp.]